VDSQKGIKDLAQNDLSERAVVFQPLSKDQINHLILELGPNWSIDTTFTHIEKQLSFSNYMEGVDLVNWLARQAEEHNHHPDIYLGYKKMTLLLTTHNISALSLADFILAAKIEKYLSEHFN
jgi:4a-hydroxytetrahydrobiopterin dehydratase